MDKNLLSLEVSIGKPFLYVNEILVTKSGSMLVLVGLRILFIRD